MSADEPPVPTLDFERLFHSLPGLYLVLLPDSPRFSIVDASDAYLSATKMERSAIVGRGLFEVFPEAHPGATGASSLRASLERVIASRKPDTMALQRYDIPRPESEGGGFEERFWSPVNAPLVDRDGTLTHLVHRIEDVTELLKLDPKLHEQQSAMEAEVYRRGQKLQAYDRELRELQARLEARTRELEQSNQLLDGFTYSVSHDLRAPLRAIAGFAKILVEDHGPALGPEGARVARVITKNTERMGRLIDDLLAFSRFGRQPVQHGNVDMTALATMVAQEVKEPDRRIDLEIDPLPPAWGDQSLLRQVWTNLLANAVKFTRPRETAQIRVTGSRVNGECIYVVADNGVGFDERYASTLFDVFQRLHASSEFEGTGVGLALVHRILRRHGGWIRGESKEGRGATFTFGLPAKEGG